MENIISAVLLLGKGCMEDKGCGKKDCFLSKSGTTRGRLVVKLQEKKHHTKLVVISMQII